MDFLTRFGDLVVNRIPTAVAQVVLALLLFPFRPYPSVLRLARYGRNNRIPPSLFPACFFAIMMLIVGFYRPSIAAIFHLSGTVQKIATSLTGPGEKIDVLYLAICSLGLTSIVIFCRLCVEQITSVRYKLTFRALYYIAITLSLPWTYAFAFLSLLLLYSVDSIAFEFLAILLFICGILPMLLFAVRMDSRWYKKSAPRYRAARVSSPLISLVIIALVAPMFQTQLARMFYPPPPPKPTTAGYPVDAAENFSVACYPSDDGLYLSIGAFNHTDRMIFAQDLYLEFTVLGSGTFDIPINDTDLFLKLKEKSAIPPKGSISLSVQLSNLALKGKKWTFGPDNIMFECYIVGWETISKDRQDLTADLKFLD
jgi:hypothetical protein